MDCAQVNHDAQQHQQQHQQQPTNETPSSSPPVQRRMSTICRQTSLYESIQQKQRDTAATKLRSLRRSCIETGPHEATTSLTAGQKLIDLPVIVKAPRNGSLLPRSTSARERYIPPPVIDLARQSLLRCGLGSRATSFEMGGSLDASRDLSRVECENDGNDTAEQ